VTPPDTTATIVQSLLMVVLLPVWLLAGFGDWLCHRVQRIEETTGLKESLMHLMLIAEIGLGVCAALFFEVDAAVLVLLVACCVAHELTTWWDLSYAMTLRRIPVVEQWVHSLQMVLPWTGLIALMVLHPEQAVSLVGLGTQSPDWGWHWKEPPLPMSFIVAAVLASGLFVWLPFMQEAWRCLRTRRAGGAPNRTRTGTLPFG
jgi:hypothetical protein